MYIKVKVTPGAKKEKFEQIREDQFKVSVKEPAKMNMANRRVIELVARHFNLPKKKVRLITGHRALNKILSVGAE